MAYYRVEPWDTTPRLLATLCAVVANLMRSEGQSAIEPDVFMPHFGMAEPDPQTELRRRVEAEHQTFMRRR